MPKCAIYCRVSSDEQAERGTIDAQIQYAKKYLELHGPEDGITEHEFYLDEGVSGTIPLASRPAGAKLISDIKQGNFQILYVYRLDRLARSVKHVLDTYDLLEKKEIALKSMTEAFDTGTPTGKFFMTLLASIAALERDTILERTLLGKERNAREGKWVSGPPPFGYNIGSDGHLEVNAKEAETVQLIYSLYKDDLSTIDIAEYLNARQIPTPAVSKRSKNNSTGKWHAGHVSIILRTEAYSGIYKYLKRSKRKKDTIDIKVPVIIENENFDLTQKKLIDKADAARGSRGRNYLLRGLVYCGHCGRAMVGSTGDSKKGRVYYRCTGTTNNGSGKRCDAKLIRARDIEDAVWHDIKAFIDDPGKILNIMESKVYKNKEDINPVKTELQDVEKAILEKQAARGKVLSLCTRGVISDQEAEDELATLASEISSLNARKEFLFEKQETAQKFETEALNARMILEQIKDDFNSFSEKDKAEYIHGLVRRIEIYTVINEEKKRGTRAVIHYRFNKPDGPDDSGKSKQKDGMELNVSGNVKVR